MEKKFYFVKLSAYNGNGLTDKTFIAEANDEDSLHRKLYNMYKSLYEISIEQITKIEYYTSDTHGDTRISPEYFWG